MNLIAYELEKEFDCFKPIVFTGTYKIPKSIIEDAYVEYGSEMDAPADRFCGRASVGEVLQGIRRVGGADAFSFRTGLGQIMVIASNCF